jgi:hypothetical protein
MIVGLHNVRFGRDILVLAEFVSFFLQNLTLCDPEVASSCFFLWVSLVFFFSFGF